MKSQCRSYRNLPRRLYKASPRYFQGVRVWLPKIVDRNEIKRKLSHDSLISDRGFLTYFWEVPRRVPHFSLLLEPLMTESHANSKMKS